MTVAGLADALRGRPPDAVLLAVKAMPTAVAFEIVITESFQGGARAQFPRVG